MSPIQAQPNEKLEVIPPNMTTCDNISIRFQLLRNKFSSHTLHATSCDAFCSLFPQQPGSGPVGRAKAKILKTTDFLDILIKFRLCRRVRQVSETWKQQQLLPICVEEIVSPSLSRPLPAFISG
jgi:hypothetical protein